MYFVWKLEVIFYWINHFMFLFIIFKFCFVIFNFKVFAAVSKDLLEAMFQSFVTVVISLYMYCVGTFSIV